MVSKRKDDSTVHEFDDDATSQASSGIVEFDPNISAEAMAAELDLDDEETADTLAIEDDWVAAQDELESSLGGSEQLAQAFAADACMTTGAADRIVGTGIGFRTIGGLLTPEPALKVYVTENIAGPQSVGGGSIPSKVGELPVEVEEVGEIVPSSYARRFARPVPCGVSIGHPEITAGTLGCLVVLRNNKLCLLSNNHVVSNSNDARIGDPCLQPGPLDGGRMPGDRIGILEDFVRINFPGPNTVDGGVVWTSFRLVSPNHVTYTMNPRPVRPRLGMAVMKNGRTTQATMGMITDVSARINIPYSGGVATFRDQIGVRGVGGVFSRGGDSGSVIVSLRSRQPVCLLFAGRRDNSVTFANPIDEVMRQLNIARFLSRQ